MTDGEATGEEDEVPDDVSLEQTVPQVDQSSFPPLKYVVLTREIDENQPYTVVISIDADRPAPH